MSDTPKSIASRFVSFCVLVLIGILAIWIALDVLSRIWGWVVLIVVIVVLAYVGILLFRRWRNRW
jgi:heme/copper-type cytochrome/quinol oxidase subunit 4